MVEAPDAADRAAPEKEIENRLAEAASLRNVAADLEKLAKELEQQARKREQEQARKREQEQARKLEQEQARKLEQEQARKLEQEQARKREQELAIKREQELARKRKQEEKATGNNGEMKVMPRDDFQLISDFQWKTARVVDLSRFGAHRFQFENFWDATVALISLGHGTVLQRFAFNDSRGRQMRDPARQREHYQVPVGCAAHDVLVAGREFYHNDYNLVKAMHNYLSPRGAESWEVERLRKHRWSSRP